MATKKNINRKGRYKGLMAAVSGNSSGLPLDAKSKQERFKSLYNYVMGDDTAADRYLEEQKKKKDAKATEKTKAEKTDTKAEEKAKTESPLAESGKSIATAQKKADDDERRKTLASGNGPVNSAKAGTSPSDPDYKNFKANDDEFKNSLFEKTFEDSLFIDTSNPDAPLRMPSVEEQKARTERIAKKSVLRDSKKEDDKSNKGFTFTISPMSFDDAVKGFNAYNNSTPEIRKKAFDQATNGIPEFKAVKAFGKNAETGLSSFNANLFKSIDFLIPDVVPDEYNVIKKGKSYYIKENERITAEADAATEALNLGTAGRVGAQIVRSTAQAAPDAILAMISMGASEGASLVEQGTTIGSGALATAQAMVKNPAFWSSFMQEAGSDYEEAKSRGASETQATLYGTLAALLNAGVEVGGGVQTLPKKLQTSKSAKEIAWDWVKSNLEEGGEEIVQGTVSNALAKLIYEPDMKVWSTSTDENDTALFNPVKSAQEGAMGFAVGAVLSSGQIAAIKGINAVMNHDGGNTVKQIGKLMGNDTEVVNGLIDTALTLDEDSDAYQYGELIKEKLDNGGKATTSEIGTLTLLNEQELTKTETTVTNGQTVPKAQNANELNPITTEPATVPIAAQNSRGTENINNYNLGISETQQSGSVRQYSGDNKNIAHIDSELVSQGVSDTNRTAIVNSLESIESTKNSASRVTATDTITAAQQTTDNINNAMQVATGGRITNEERFKLVGTNLNMVANDTVSVEDVSSYADVYTAALARSNPAEYNILSEGGNNPADVLTDYLMTGTIPAEISDIDVVKVNSGALAGVISGSVTEAAALSGSLHGGSSMLFVQAASLRNKDYSFIYNAAGANNESVVNQINNSVTNDLTDTTANGNIQSGAGNVLADESAAGRAQFDEVRNEDKIPGLLVDEYADALSREEKTTLDIIGKKLGVPIKIIESIAVNPETGAQIPDTTTVNGVYYNGVIYISLEAEDKPMIVMSHEVTHHMAAQANEEFKLYSNHVLNALANKNNTDVQSLVDEKIASYERRGMKLNYDEAVEEIAADYTRKFLNDADSAVEFIDSIESPQARRNILRRFVDAIRSILSKLRSSFKRVPQEVRDLHKAQALFNDMAKATAESNIKVNENSRYSFAGEDAAYSLSNEELNIYDYTKPFAEQIDDWRQGKIPQYDSLLVSGTPESLQTIGFNPLPVTINQSHIDYAINGTKDIDHHLGESILKQLPERLKDPIAVIASETQSDTRVVAILDMQHNGKNIVVPVEIDGYARQNDLRIDSNAITSVFGKGNAVTKLLNNAITKEQSGDIAVYYMDKNKTAALLQRAGLQLPGGLFRNNGYIHSINEKGSPVKTRFKNITETQQFKRWFGDWEKSPHTASKVVNDDGTPRVVYHGTPYGGFNEFKNWQHFTSDKSYADVYQAPSASSIRGRYDQADNPMTYAVYLNMRKPFDTRDPKIRKIWQDEFYMKYGDGTPLSERGLPDWTEGIDLIEFIEDNDYDFDGVILDEGGTGGYGEVVKDRGISYVVRNSEQIKSATDNIGTFDASNPDIRYSINQSTGRVTASSLASDVINAYGVKNRVARATVSEGIENVRSRLYDTYFGKGDINEKYAELESTARETAEQIAYKMRTVDESSKETYDMLRRDIKGTKISVSEQTKSDIPDWNDWKKANFGKLTISNDGIPVDSYYRELMEKYPQFFNETLEMTQADQLENIVNVLDNIKPSEIELTADERQAVIEEITSDIIEKAMQLEDDMVSGSTSVRNNPATYQNGEVRLKTQNVRQVEREKARVREQAKLEKARETHRKQIAESRAKAKAKSDEKWAARLDKLDEQWQKNYNKKVKEIDEKYGERLDKQKQHEKDTVQKLKDKAREQKERARERRSESDERHRLLKIAKRIQGMKMSEAERAKIPDIIAEIDTKSLGLREEGYTRADGTKVQGRLDLQNLKNKILDAQKNDPDYIPDPQLMEKITRLDKMHIKDMEISDVRNLINTVVQVEHEIKNNRKLLNDARNREIVDVAKKSIDEIRHSKGVNKTMDTPIDRYAVTQLSPLRFAKRISGYTNDSAIVGLFNDLNEGAHKSLMFQMNASRKFDSLIQDRAAMKKFTGKNAELIDISKYDPEGRKVVITPEMRVSLYLHSKNYSNLRHIQYGGITIPDIDLLNKGKRGTAYDSKGITIKLSPSQVKEITSGMTNFERMFADAAYTFFNEDTKKAVNETSLVLKGYELATVENYFPLNSDKRFLKSEFESLLNDGSLEGMGMLQERTNGSNPIYLEGVTSVISRHMKNVGDYSGLAIPIRNFNKVYNFTGSKYNYSFKSAIGSKWGQTASTYIERLMTDLQGRGKKGNTTIGLLGKYAQATLSVNVGVTLKQAASYPTAAAVLGWGPLAKAFSERVTAEDRKIIEKYTPLLWYRSKGYNITEIGDYADGTAADWTKQGKLPWLMGWIQGMDMATTTKLWKAAEFYVREHNSNLQKGTDAYYKKVTEVYNRVIEETQPNYTTMQRPDILRQASGNAIFKALTMFKTQPMQNFNILYDAYGEFRARQEDYKNSKTETNKADAGKAGKKLVLAIGSQLVAALVLNFFDGVGRAVKGQFKKHYGGNSDDDDGEVTPESLISAYVQDNLSTLMGNAWLGSEAGTMLAKMLGDHGIGRGAVWYDITAPELEMISNIVSDFQNINTMFAKGKTNPWNIAKKLSRAAYDFAQLKGIPAKNMRNLLTGTYKNIISFTNSEDIFELLDAWNDNESISVTIGSGKKAEKYEGKLSFGQYLEFKKYYDTELEKYTSGEKRKKDGTKYGDDYAKGLAKKAAVEKYKSWFAKVDK